MLCQKNLRWYSLGKSHPTISSRTNNNIIFMITMHFHSKLTAWPHLLATCQLWSMCILFWLISSSLQLFPVKPLILPAGMYMLPCSIIMILFHACRPQHKNADLVFWLQVWQCSGCYSYEMIPSELSTTANSWYQNKCTAVVWYTPYLLIPCMCACTCMYVCVVFMRILNIGCHLLQAVMLSVYSHLKYNGTAKSCCC